MKEIIKEDKVPSLEIAAEEYDPFLVEKYMQFLK